jgi:hypothetical protein
MEDIIADFPHHKIICGGDFNVNLSSNKKTAIIIRALMKSSKTFAFSDDLSKNSNECNYMYKHVSFDHQSCIDYFVVRVGKLGTIN